MTKKTKLIIIGSSLIVTGVALYFILNKEFSREKFTNYLLEKGIQTGDAYTPSCHQQTAFEDYIGDQDFSVTEDILQRHVSLPMYVGMSKEDTDYIINTITSL